MDILSPAPGHRALRKGRQSIAGQLYLVTTTTKSRAPIFRDPRLAMIASRAVCDPRLWLDSRLRCWVLMPDHWHGLVELGAQEPLGRVVQRLKLNVARSVNIVRATRQGLWSPAYHDHALRAEEDVLSVARYIVLNPVRAGLVSRIWDYPYWNAEWLYQRNGNVGAT